MAACIHAHKMAKVVDEESVDHLESRMLSEESSASEHALVQCATFYALAGGAESWKAKGMAERALQINRDYHQAQTLLGWIELGSGGAGGDDDWDDDDLGIASPGASKDAERARLEKAARHFDQVLDADGGDRELEALMGRVKVLESAGQLRGALEVLNHIVVQFSWFIPAMAEKARLQMMSGDWDAALETSQRIQGTDQQNIESLRLIILYLLSCEGQVDAARKKIAELTDALNTLEPRNAGLYTTCARDIARLSGGNPAILGGCSAMLERARRLQPENVATLNEAAYQQQLGGDYKTAIASYRHAAQIDERDGTLDDLSSLYGTIHCQLLDNQLDDAAQQLDFLNDVATERNVKLVFLTALHASKIPHGDVETPLQELEAMLAAHVTAAQRRPFSYDYFVHLDPDLLLECAELFLTQESGEPRAAGEALSPGLERAMALLEAVCRRAPGLMPAQLLLMRTRYLAGQHDAAARTANAILHLDDGCADAHLVLSQIHLSKGNHRSAQNALDNAIANNFAVRESPLYSIISAQCKVLDNDYAGGLKELEAAMKLPGVKTGMTEREAEAARRKKALPISTQDRATVYLKYVEVLGHLNRTAEADAMLKSAMAEFQGTTEEVRVMIANCELALLKGDTNRALKMLIRVPPDSPHYARAKMALAKIHLEKRNDKGAYIKCYEDLVGQAGDAKSYIALGEAYMAIGEPDMAVKAYERAARHAPGDANLSSKIGRALIITHDFARAVEYYEAARVNNPGAMQMQIELAQLYVRLRKYGNAEAVLSELLENLSEATDPQSLEHGVACTRMLAKVHAGMGDVQGHFNALLQARTLQTTLVTRSRGDAEALRTQQGVLAELCMTIAEEYRKHHDIDNASSFYNEALKHDEGNLSAMLALAKVKLNAGDVDSCQQVCVSILREDGDNEEASLMLAELMFQKEHYDTAIYHFQQLLEKNPRNYRALAQLVQLLRRSGRLEEVPQYLKLADRSSPAAAHEPGLHFCKGLAERYNNKAHEALGHLNKCRKDREWGPDAVYTMVEIYLSPENEQLWDEEGSSMLSDGPTQLENTDHIRAAEKLLCEVRRRQDPRHRVLEAYALIATKSKPSIDNALTMLIEIVNSDHDNVPALLAMATCFMLLKQTPKARNQLKRVSKLPFNSAEADEFERSWLMLADIYIQGGKYDLAQEMCKKCLKYNKSCAKAWELIGQVMEREQSYMDAAEHYERSWKFSSESSPAVGFRLAFNYLKAKRFVEAIDVCQKVLKEHPTYPKIQKDILDKARLSIKP